MFIVFTHLDTLFQGPRGASIDDLDQFRLYFQAIAASTMPGSRTTFQTAVNVFFHFHGFIYRVYPFDENSKGYAVPEGLKGILFLHFCDDNSKIRELTIRSPLATTTNHQSSLILLIREIQ